jgi:hypothetical protein
LVHFVNLADPTDVIDYLKITWAAKGGIGSSQFYVVVLRNEESLALMNFEQIFDFQRMVLLFEDTVGTQYNILVHLLYSD